MTRDVDRSASSKKSGFSRAVDAVLGWFGNAGTGLGGMLGGTIALGAVVIIVFACGADSVSKAIETASIAILVGGASGLVGGLIGFLFGIPRALQTDDAPAAGAGNADDAASKARGNAVRYGANTNLEQISDWLTKILVGVGLTQLTTVPQRVEALGAYLGPALGSTAHPEVMAVSVVIYFGVAGFLSAFLWTRLNLGKAFRDADIEALGQKVNELELRAQRNARALSLVTQQLDPHLGAPEVTEKELDAAIESASADAKAMVFRQAHDVRSANWDDPATKSVMERTIPIFRALIKSDTRRLYHANHGQLGYALKDQSNPDWAAAEKELSTAIEIRGSWKQEGRLYYEYNRALCRITLDDAQAGDAPAPPERRAAILADLKAAASLGDLFDVMQADPKIREWLTKNGLTIESLRK